MAATFDSVDLLGAMPTTAEMEAPVWPGAEPAPPVRPRSSPPVPPRLAAASIVPRMAVVEDAPRKPVVEVVTPAPVVEEPAFDAAADAWFAEGPFAEDPFADLPIGDEPYADPYFDQRPTSPPWWAVAIPASAALGMVAMVLTALVLVASRA